MYTKRILKLFSYNCHLGYQPPTCGVFLNKQLWYFHLKTESLLQSPKRKTTEYVTSTYWTSYFFCFSAKFAFFNKEAAKWSASVFRTLRWRQGKQENKWALWEVKITNLWKIRKGVFSQIWGRATLLTKKGRKTRTFRLFVNFLSIFSCRRQH